MANLQRRSILQTISADNTAGTGAGIQHSLSAQIRVSLVIALALVPFLGTVLFTAGLWPALNQLAYATVVVLAGYCIVGLALPISAREQGILLAPAAGILVVSSLAAFWVRMGLPLIWVLGLWLLLGAGGLLFLWRDRTLWMRGTVAYGGSLVFLSVLVCGVYFLPGARNDAVMRSDGSFNWIYVDTQYNQSIAAGVKNAEPPKTPGTATADLLYHFGPYAPAALISRVDGLGLGDAFARVTRGVSVWALVLSCFGLGMLLSVKATGSRFGGVLSTAGFFFYGSLFSLFNDEWNSSTHLKGPAFIFNIPGAEVPGSGGPFSHLILGHSVLHGMLAITAVMGLCLLARELDQFWSWRTLALFSLPAIAVAMHSAAALYCIAVVGILLLWERLANLRSWMALVFMLGLFVGAWRIMGFSHAPDAALMTINKHPFGDWWAVAIWFTAGLGLRSLGLRWISRSLRDPLSVLIGASVVGLLSFSLVLHFEHGQQRYGFYFLQCVLALFAFSRLKPGFWRALDRTSWTGEWLMIAASGITVLLVPIILLRASSRLLHRGSAVSFRQEILPFLLVLVLITLVLLLMKRNQRFSNMSSAVVVCVLSIGFFAWIGPLLNFGMDRMKMDVTVTPGEVRGLERLNELSKPDERFATNKHSMDNFAGSPARSYAYGTLAERPVLLEGYAYQGVTSISGFKDLLRDNDLMFSTADPDRLHQLARTWHVRWLVARPGTDLALARPLPGWLVEQQGTGDLKIYRVN